MACSALHARPRFSATNPARSRIRVVFDELNDVYVPTRAGDYTPAECTGRHKYVINGKEYNECSFCGVSCPARDYFCLLYTSPSPRDGLLSRMPSSA